MRIKAGSIRKGFFLDWKGSPVLVISKDFFNPGKGRAVVRLKLKDIQSGRVVQETILTDEAVRQIAVSYRRAQFLYADGDKFIFADPASFKQEEISGKTVGDKKKFLKNGEIYRICFYGQQPLGLILPKKMTLQIVKTEAGAKGDTVSGAVKTATLETGLAIKVPLFVKEGEKVVVNTDKGDYLKRAKE